MKTKLRGLVRKYVTRKLAVQLTLLFMAVFLAVVSVSYVLLYFYIESVFRKNYEDSTLAVFEQSDYGLNTLLETMDYVSRKLIMDAELDGLFYYGNLSAMEQVHLSRSAFQQFDNIIKHYPYICSIAYYTSEGLCLKTSNEGNYPAYGPQVLEDWFFQTPVFLQAQENRQKLVVFGGYGAEDFGLLPDKTNNPSGRYICLARNTRSRNSTGTIILNISMEHFTQVFANPAIKHQGSVYLINEEGLVLADTDAARVGQPSPQFVALPPDERLRTSTVNVDGEELESVYYRLDAPVGILVSEVPRHAVTADVGRMRAMILVLFGGGTLLVFLLFSLWLKRLMRPLHELTTAFRQLESGHLGITIPEGRVHNELGELIEEFNLMSAAIEQMLDQNLHNEKEKRTLEMQALRAQINPHFIYNTLNIIKWMAVIDHKDNIAECITTFSQFLQATLRESDPYFPLDTELEYLANYVKIMNYRFSGGLVLQDEVAGEYRDCQIIRFLLQPVVENAIVHGLADTMGGVIRISVDEVDGALWVNVDDNGHGFSAQALETLPPALKRPDGEDTGHIGLVNISRRIKLHYGSKYGVAICNSRDGARVGVHLPLRRMPAAPAEGTAPTLDEKS